MGLGMQLLPAASLSARQVAFALPAAPVRGFARQGAAAVQLPHVRCLSMAPPRCRPLTTAAPPRGLCPATAAVGAEAVSAELTCFLRSCPPRH